MSDADDKRDAPAPDASPETAQDAAGRQLGRPLSQNLEAVRKRKQRLRRAVKKAMEAAPAPALPASPHASMMATTKLVEAGVVRRGRMGRMYEVEQMMFRGASTGQILRRICADFGVGETQVAEDVRRLRPEVARAIAESSRVPVAERRAADREMLVDLYDRCIVAGDRAVAERVAHRIARIDGAEQPLRVEVSLKPLSDAEAEASARELLEMFEIAKGRVIDATATETVDDKAPRVLPAPEEMH